MRSGNSNVKKKRKMSITGKENLKLPNRHTRS
jgi:hypothetical protein